MEPTLPPGPSKRARVAMNEQSGRMAQYRKVAVFEQAVTLTATVTSTTAGTIAGPRLRTEPLCWALV